MVSGLPAGILEPLALVAVEACGEPSVQLRHSPCGPSPAVAEVSIPLTAWVRDARGCVCAGCSTLILCAHLPCACLRECASLTAAACVRLIDGGCSCAATFDARLAVRVEVFAVRVEPCRPFCQKPFYPQPFYLGSENAW